MLEPPASTEDDDNQVDIDSDRGSRTIDSDADGAVVESNDYHDVRQASEDEDTLLPPTGTKSKRPASPIADSRYKAKKAKGLVSKVDHVEIPTEPSKEIM